MDTVNFRSRDHRRDHRRDLRRRSSDHVQRKYNYRGVKRAIGAAAFGALAVYLVISGLGAFIEFIT